MSMCIRPCIGGSLSMDVLARAPSCQARRETVQARTRLLVPSRHHALRQFVELLLLAGIGAAARLVLVTLHQLAQPLQAHVALAPALAHLGQVVLVPGHAALLLVDGGVQLAEEALVVDHPLPGDALAAGGQPLLLIFAQVALQFAQLRLALHQFLLGLTQRARRVTLRPGRLLHHRSQALDSPIAHGRSSGSHWKTDASWAAFCSSFWPPSLRPWRR